MKTREAAICLLRQVLACNGLRSKALLTVDLSGTVLEYERGYRAERQRVLRVEFEDACIVCERASQPGRATRLGAARELATRPFTRAPAPARLNPPALPLQPVCARHVPTGARTVTLPELAGLLGAEVRWLESC
jgi:hypothetical protein